MTTGQALRTVLLDNPEDPLARFAYADWLEEQGDTDSAQREQTRQALIGASLSAWYAKGKPEPSKIVDLAPITVSRHLVTAGAFDWTAFQVFRRYTRQLRFHSETGFAVIDRALTMALHSSNNLLGGHLRSLRNDIVLLAHNFCEPDPKFNVPDAASAAFPKA